MNKIVKILPITLFTTFLITSCGGNAKPKDTISASLISNTLIMDNNSGTKYKEFVTHFSIKDEFKTEYVLPYIPDSVTVDGNDLIPNIDYTFLDNTLTIDASKVTGDIKITAEAIKAGGKISIVSDTLKLSSDLISKDIPIFVYYDEEKYSGEDYYLPSRFTSVMMGDKKLEYNVDYTFNTILGTFTLKIEQTAPIVIKGELITYHTVKTTSTLGDNVVELVYPNIKVEASDNAVHVTDIKIKDTAINSYVIENKQPTITLGDTPIACDGYKLSEELDEISVYYKIPTTPFVDASKNLSITISVSELTDPHEIVIKSDASYKNFYIRNANPVISKSKGINIEIGYKSEDEEEEKYAIVPDDGFTNIKATLTDASEPTPNEVHSVSCRISNGHFVFSFDKLPQKVAFASGNLTLSFENLSDSNFGPYVQINGTIEEAVDSNNVTIIFGLFGFGFSSIDCPIIIHPKDGYIIKEDLTADDVKTALMKAHDTADKTGINHIKAHEINLDTLEKNKERLSVTLNLREVYHVDSKSDAKLITFDSLDSLVSEQP